MSDLFDSSTATISPCGLYRYSLTRRWGAATDPVVVWIMLNPSTADADTDDPTIRRCIRFSQEWGMGGLEVVNLFALRSTVPAMLLTAASPVGPDNDEAILDAVGRRGVVVAAWGAVHKRLRWRIEEVRALVAVKLLAIGLTDAGHPKHPLARGKAFVPYGVPLVDLGGGS